MNGFETLIDVVQRRHLGKLQRYLLNVVSTNRHYNPYDLITVPDNKVHFFFLNLLEQLRFMVFI